jgi:hypothetical protein
MAVSVMIVPDSPAGERSGKQCIADAEVLNAVSAIRPRVNE